MVAGDNTMRSVILLGLIVLSASLAAGQEPNRTAKQQYEALLKEYESASETWSKVYDDGTGRADPVKRHQAWPAWSFVPRFFALAEAHPGDPAAVDALLWVVHLDQAVGENDRALLPQYGVRLEILRGTCSRTSAWRNSAC